MNRKLILYSSASAFAIASAAERNNHTFQTVALETFNTQKLDPRDYDYWWSVVNEVRGKAQNCLSQEADSEKADREAKKP